MTYKLTHVGSDMRGRGSSTFTDPAAALAWFHERSSEGRISIEHDNKLVIHQADDPRKNRVGKTPMDRALKAAAREAATKAAAERREKRTLMAPGRSTTVILTDAERDRLTAIGGGSMVQGIRNLLANEDAFHD